MPTQLTLIQIDNYGPWTVTPHPRREVDLQTLQSRLYADLSQLFGATQGYVFYGRFDNMIAVTNGADVDRHALVQESIGNRYPVSISLSIAVGASPLDTLSTATEQLQRVGSAQDDDRREILRGETTGEGSDHDVQLAHFDVNDATDKYTDRMNEFDSVVRIKEGYMELTRYLRDATGSLTFFVGGDNIISVCPRLSRADYAEAITHVRESVGIELKAGVGRGATAQDAGMAAKHALEECRDHGELVVGP